MNWVFMILQIERNKRFFDGETSKLKKKKNFHCQITTVIWKEMKIEIISNLVDEF